MKKSFFLLLLLWAGIQLSAQTIVQQFVSVGSASQVIDMDTPLPSTEGNTLIAMPGPLSPGVSVLSVTDNSPNGGNKYTNVPGSVSSCDKKPLSIWYCENCKGGVTELKYHLSDFSKGAINTFLEVADLAPDSVLDGEGKTVSDGTATSAGLEAGPSIATTATDFVIARFSSAAPIPKAVTPAGWTYKTSYLYFVNAPSGTYQPTLTGAPPAGNYCMSMAAFKTAAHSAQSKPAAHEKFGARHFPF
jgi:hypothetical protein